MRKAVRAQDLRALLAAPSHVSLGLYLIPAGGGRQALLPHFTDGMRDSRWLPGPGGLPLNPHCLPVRRPRCAPALLWACLPGAQVGVTTPLSVQYQEALGRDTAQPHNA